MDEIYLGEQELRFANLIWDNAPINSTDLVRLAKVEMNWKKSTTYTMLRRLCDRGIFKNENATVTAVLSREKFNSKKSKRFVDDAFDGSLPKFIAAFVSGNKLSANQADELIQMINEHKE